MTDTPESIVAEYREAYRRAQALQAYWIWHAITNGQAPDMVPRDLMRPSGRCVWCLDTDGPEPEELPTDEQIAEWERLAAPEGIRLDHNWATGEPASTPEEIEAWRQAKLKPQILQWDDEGRSAIEHQQPARLEWDAP
jgi:hypothetical protein